MCFSVAMATFNGEAYVADQLKSIAEQSVKPAHIVVCDDASTDGTIRVLERFSQLSSIRFTLLQNSSNEGHGSSFLRAAACCDTDWILFSDQDDVWHGKKIESIVSLIEKHPCSDLISHSAEQVQADLTPTGVPHPRYRRRTITGPRRNRPLHDIPGFTMCVRRWMFDPVLIEERPSDRYRMGLRQPHDQYAAQLANCFGWTLRTPEKLVRYRRHESSVTGQAGSGMYEKNTTLRKAGANQLSKLNAGLVKQAQIVSEAADQLERVRARRAELTIAKAKLDQLGEVVCYLRKVADLATRRSRVYVADAPFSSRTRALVSCLRNGVYFRTDGTKAYGIAGFLRDLTSCVHPLRRGKKLSS